MWRYLVVLRVARAEVAKGFTNPQWIQERKKRDIGTIERAPLPTLHRQDLSVASDKRALELQA